MTIGLSVRLLELQFLSLSWLNVGLAGSMTEIIATMPHLITSTFAQQKRISIPSLPFYADMLDITLILLCFLLQRETERKNGWLF